MSKYTKEQLQAMSDFEVNKALAELLGFLKVRNFNILVPALISVTDICCDTLDEIESCVNYCNTPNDIMPLAFEHKIWLQSVEAKNGLSWIAGANTWHAIHHENPLRATACCRILVLQEENSQ